MDFSFSENNLNSVENLPGCEARAAFTVNSILRYTNCISTSSNFYGCWR